MNFKLARIRAGKTIKEVCAALGVSQMALYNWEHGLGYPTVHNLMRLCDLYGCTPNDLLLG